jgi:DNA-binding response OmpR family regulator
MQQPSRLIAGAPDRYTITLDDDPQVHRAIAQATGIESRWFASSAKIPAGDELNPLAVFVDVGMSVASAENGQLIPKLKDHWPLSPIILTAQSENSDMLLEAMALGADDFVAKPIEPREITRRFEVRLAALARRAARETIKVGDLAIDTLQRSVSSTRGVKFLSPTEIKLISELAKAGGDVVPRELLKSRCWPQMEVSDNALNRKLYEVRRRLMPLSEKINIRTIYGVGFVLEVK